MKFSCRTYLALLSLPGIGRKTAFRLRSHFDVDPLDVADFSEGLQVAKNNKVRVPALSLDDVKEALRRADNQLDTANDKNIKIIGYDDSLYPSRLRSTPDAPIVLFGMGHMEALNADTLVAVIGTRHPSKGFEAIAFETGAHLARRGVVVISGLAVGCDTMGHSGCVHEQGRGIAVLAGGLDKIHPNSNISLAGSLLDEGGCLLSEYPIGFTPRPNTFVDRDRIQSGLSDGVIVIETNVDGGSMHTVGYAEAQDRPLACTMNPAPGKDHENPVGNIALINQGRATALSSPDDLDAFLLDLDRTPKMSDPNETTDRASLNPTNSDQTSFKFEET